MSYLVLNDITIYWWYGVGKTWYNSNHTFHALIKLLSSVTKYLLKLKNASDEIQTSKPTIWDHWKLRQLLFFIILCTFSLRVSPCNKTTNLFKNRATLYLRCYAIISTETDTVVSVYWLLINSKETLYFFTSL